MEDKATTKTNEERRVTTLVSNVTAILAAALSKTYELRPQPPEPGTLHRV